MGSGSSLFLPLTLSPSVNYLPHSGIFFLRNRSHFCSVPKQDNTEGRFCLVYLSSQSVSRIFTEFRPKPNSAEQKDGKVLLKKSTKKWMDHLWKEIEKLLMSFSSQLLRKPGSVIYQSRKKLKWICWARCQQSTQHQWWHFQRLLLQCSAVKWVMFTWLLPIPWLWLPAGQHDFSWRTRATAMQQPSLSRALPSTFRSTFSSTRSWTVRGQFLRTCLIYLFTRWFCCCI